MRLEQVDKPTRSNLHCCRVDELPGVAEDHDNNEDENDNDDNSKSNFIHTKAAGNVLGIKSVPGSPLGHPPLGNASIGSPYAVDIVGTPEQHLIDEDNIGKKKVYLEKDKTIEGQGSWHYDSRYLLPTLQHHSK